MSLTISHAFIMSSTEFILFMRIINYANQNLVPSRRKLTKERSEKEHESNQLTAVLLCFRLDSLCKDV